MKTSSRRSRGARSRGGVGGSVAEQLERDAAARDPLVAFLARRIAVGPASDVHGHGARVLALTMRPVGRRDADELDERAHGRLPAATLPRRGASSRAPM